jgi:hypothetical protein
MVDAKSCSKRTAFLLFIFLSPTPPYLKIVSAPENDLPVLFFYTLPLCDRIG